MAGLAIAIGRSWESIREVTFPEWPHSTAALAALLFSLYTALRGWAAILDGEGSARELARGYYLSMLGKYVPGGIWQPVGQIVMASGATVTGKKATSGFLAHCAVQVAAGGVFAVLFAALGAGVSSWIRCAALAGICGIALLHRGWLHSLVASLGRWLPRGLGIGIAELIPTQGAILRSFGWSIPTLGFSGAALAVIVGAMGGEDPFVFVGLAFGFAWIVGFLAIPFPSGVAIREAVLVATLATGAPLVLAASVIHRFLMFCAEIIVLLAALGRR